MSPDRTRPLVLLAEGDEGVLAGVELELRRAAFTVVSATNGAQTLKLALELKPDLAVIDLTTPRLGGLELAREIRRPDWPASTPVILLAARARDTDFAAGVRAALERRARARSVSCRGGRRRTG